MSVFGTLAATREFNEIERRDIVTIYDISKSTKFGQSDILYLSSEQTAFKENVESVDSSDSERDMYANGGNYKNKKDDGYKN